MKELISKLIDEIGPGHMGSTAYDTAWLAWHEWARAWRLLFVPLGD